MTVDEKLDLLIKKLQDLHCYMERRFDRLEDIFDRRDRPGECGKTSDTSAKTID
ncbi:hypothetical protein [Bacillus suaedaesalsae]|uniref:Uncharacterized protein n=1 Tax=Bacillus suaedaesalsae TaxID=2810349 RepID=A0ABS2DKW8_9BACI|nr:hypothetical protein [Bacillus suaedaesalsae]MBM6619051.1 hypothetical protein [Bacillus suaedaesalsae]